MSSTESQREVIEQLAEEFVTRYRQGERPPVSEYLQRCPGQEAEVREVLEAALMMERLAPASHSVGPPTASEWLPQVQEPQLRTLGDFRIVREVGRGGMGIVYEAEQVSLGRRVALKVLPQHLLAGEKQRKRFEREARAAARLHHTNIVPVFGVGVQDGLHYYVMQFIHGQGLDEVIVELKRLRQQSEAGHQPTEPKVPVAVTASAEQAAQVSAAEVANVLLTGQIDRTALFGDLSDASSLDESNSSPQPATFNAVDTAVGRLAETVPDNGSFALPGQSSDSHGSNRKVYWESVARIGLQAAQALHYAHEQVVIHRDIKPGNLLLDTQGTVWVTDFGLAKAADQQDLTGTGDVLGTLRYMAPEQFEGQADARSDLYSLGLTLYELLVLKPAFNETDRHKLIKQVTEGTTPRLRAIDPHIPRDLETIVHKTIDRDPSHRYTTAGELAADLECYLRDEPIRARRISPVTRFARWCRRNPAIASLTMAVVVFAVGSTTAAFAFRQVATEKATALQEKSDALMEKSDALIAKELALDSAVIARASAEQSEQRANTARRTMQRERDAAVHNLYVAQTKEFQQAWKSNNFGRLRSLLKQWNVNLDQRDHRDWEWHYLLNRLNAGMSTIRWSPKQTIKTIDWHRESGLMATSTARKIRISNPRDVVHEWVHAGSNIEHLSWSSDGRKLAYCGFQGEVGVWNRETDEFELQLDQQGGHLSCVAWHPNGSRLAFCAYDGTIVVWDLEAKQEVKRLETNHGGMISIDWSYDGRFLAASSHARIQIMKSEDWSLFELLKNQGRTGMLAWAPHAPLLALNGRDASGADCVQLWNADTIEAFKLFPLMDAALCVEWNADGSRLAFAGHDHQLHLYDVENHKRLNTWEVHDWPVRDIAWGPDETQIATVSFTDHVAVTRLNSPRHAGFDQLELEASGGRLAWHPEMPFLAVGEHNALTLWDTNKRELVWKKSRVVRDLHWTPAGDLLLSCSPQGGVVAWDPANGDSQVVVPKDEKRVNQFWLSPDGREVGVLEWNGSCLSIWDSEAESFVRDVSLAEGNVVAIAPVPNSMLIGVAMQGIPARIVTTAGELKHTLRLHRDTLTGIAASPDGTRLATISEDGTAIIWDVDTGEQSAILRGHQATITSVDWSPGSTRLVTGSRDGTVRLWDAETGVEVLRFEPGQQIRAVAWSPDGKTIAATDSGKHLTLWSANINLQEQLKRKAHGQAIQEEWPAAADAFLDPAIRKLNPRLFPKLGGICLLKAGQHEAYRRLCQEEMQKALAAETLGGLTDTVSLCGFGPDALDDYDAAIELCRKLVAHTSQGHTAVKSLGALLMRAGRYDEALEVLETDPVPSSSQTQERFICAICHHFNGNQVAARQAFNEGVVQHLKWMAQYDDTNPPSWVSAAVHSLWQQEARELIEPADVSVMPEIDQRRDELKQQPNNESAD